METTTPDTAPGERDEEGNVIRRNSLGLRINAKGHVLKGEPLKDVLPKRTAKEARSPSELVRGKIMRAIRFAGRKLEPNSEDGGSEGWWRMMAEKHPAETLRALIAVTPMPRSVTVEAGASWQELMAQAWQASAGIIDVSPEDVLALPSPTLETASDSESEPTSDPEAHP